MKPSKGMIRRSRTSLHDGGDSLSGACKNLPSKKLCGCASTTWEIKVNPAKIKEIIELPPPMNIRELRGFQSCIAYIWKFISNLFGIYEPFSKLMKNDAKFERDDGCQKAFDSIKTYLYKPPILTGPVKANPWCYTSLGLNTLLMPTSPRTEGKYLVLPQSDFSRP